jgi:hypothetical protein
MKDLKKAVVKRVHNVRKRVRHWRGRR